MSNPALTLHGHLKHMMGMAQDQRTWPDAWEMVVGLKWTAAVRPLLGLVDQTHDLLSTRSDIDLVPMMEHEKAWRSYILLPSVNQAHTMAQSGFTINPSAVNSLYAIGKLIDSFPEVTKSIHQDQIEQLSHSVAALRQAILESTDLEDDLRIFLLDRVNDMQTRLDRRQVTGDAPIQDLIVATIGSSAVHSTMWQRAMATPLRTKIVSVFIVLNAIVGGINSSADAIGHIDSAYSVSHEVIRQILGDGPSAIEAPKQHALPAAGCEPIEPNEAAGSAE